MHSSLLPGVLMVLVANGAPATAQPTAEIQVSAAWVREASATQHTTAAYLTIANRMTRSVDLLAASIDGAKAVELHKSEIQHEKMAMRKVDRVTIPAGATLKLEPGSFHIMLIGLEKAFPVGARIQVTLTFDGGVEKVVEAEVRPRMMPSSSGGGR